MKRKIKMSKYLVLLLGISLVFTLASVIINLNKMGYLNEPTGAATGTGNTYVTVQGVASIGLTDGNITFPSGYYNSSCLQNYSILYSNGTAFNCWLNTSGILPAPVFDYHTIVNNGTANINVTLDTDQSNATAFFCGTGCPAYYNHSQVNVSVMNDEAASCSSGLLSANTAILNSTTETIVTLCANMNYALNQNSINVSYILKIPSDVPQGTKTLTVTYTGTAVT